MAPKSETGTEQIEILKPIFIDRISDAAGPEPVPPGAIHPAEALIIDHCNKVRAAAGLPPVVPHACLMDAARRSNKVVADRFPGVWEHPDPSLNQYKGPCCGHCAAGENIGRGPTVESICDAWVASPLHHPLLVRGDFRLIGVCAITQHDQVFTTEAFLD